MSKRQPDLKTAYKLNRDNCKIDWTQPIDTIYNKIRGLNPFPTAWCYLDNNEDKPLSVKIYGVEKVEENHNFEVGKLIATKDELKVACQGGYINLIEMQLPGKRKMDIKSLLNGFNFSESAKLL